MLAHLGGGSMSASDEADGAWATALQQARFWLEHLGERDYAGRKMEDFSAWLNTAPNNEAAFCEVCREIFFGVPPGDHPAPPAGGAPAGPDGHEPGRRE